MKLLRLLTEVKYFRQNDSVTQSGYVVKRTNGTYVGAGGRGEVNLARAQVWRNEPVLGEACYLRPGDTYDRWSIIKVKETIMREIVR